MKKRIGVLLVLALVVGIVAPLTASAANCTGWIVESAKYMGCYGNCLGFIPGIIMRAQNYENTLVRTCTEGGRSFGDWSTSTFTNGCC
jgi:hypothetical protein